VVSRSYETTNDQPPLAKLMNTPPPKGLNPIDTMTMSTHVVRIVAWLSRQRKGATFSEISAHLGKGDEKSRKAVENLLEQGHIEQLDTSEDPRYRTVFAGKPSRPARGLSEDFWDKISD
jgi:hypothetical protein